MMIKPKPIEDARKEANAKRKAARAERKALIEEANHRLVAEAESRARLLSREASWRVEQIRAEREAGTYVEPTPF